MKRRYRVLVVDDEDSNRDLLEALLTELGHDVDMAADGLTALAMLGPSHDLALLDVMMDGIDGIELARLIRSESCVPDIPICMVTALSGKEDRLHAVEAGANDFITKPVDKVELGLRTASLLKAKEAQDVIKRHQEELEATVALRTAELSVSLQATKAEHEKTYIAHLETIERLAVAAEYRDQDSAFHIRRMSHYTELIARRLNLPAAECATLLYASSMHDIGKIGVPDSVLFKTDKLNPAEWDLMRQHPAIGARILSSSTSDLLRAGEVVALTHHERWDGSGYPQGLAGNTIPLWGRMAAIADVFDALTSRRPYKEPLSRNKALCVMHDGRGSHFDPTLFDLFVGGIDEVETIQNKYRGPEVDSQTEGTIEWPLLPRLRPPAVREEFSRSRACAAG